MRVQLLRLQADHHRRRRHDRYPRSANRRSCAMMRTHGLNRDAFDRFRNVGASWAYDVVAPGFKYNLTDVAAAIGVVQLSRAETCKGARQRAAERYLNG